MSLLQGVADWAWMALLRARLALSKPEFDPVTRQTLPRRRILPLRAVARAVARAARVAPFPPRRAAGDAAPGGEPARIIWSYWHDGEAAAPELAKLCWNSWRERNPSWELRVLDAGSVPGDADLACIPASAGEAHRADLLRVTLLRRQGGVWVDASCLCTQPLDDWLEAALSPAGFVAFARPAPDRPLANWFLAARPEAPLVAVWEEAIRRWWAVQGRPRHYFIHHYLFEWMLLADPALERAWRAVPAPSAGPAHRLQAWMAEQGSTGPDAEAARLRAALAALADPGVPAQKLDWRIADGGEKLRAAWRMRSAHADAARDGG